MDLSRRQRIANTAIDTFALIYWTLFAVALVGVIVGAFFYG